MRSTKNQNFCSSSLWTCLHHMVILRSRNKITDFLMILAWASPFNKTKLLAISKFTLCLMNPNVYLLKTEGHLDLYIAYIFFNERILQPFYENVSIQVG